jgi:hypothetical protein
MNWKLRVIAISVCSHALAHSAAGQSHLDSSSEVRVHDLGRSSFGAIAGVGYSENFEVGYQYGCVPPGCAVEIIDHPDPAFV